MNTLTEEQFQLGGYYGLLLVKGADSKKFLQGQLTCDIEQLTTDHALLGAACSIKGRAYASFFLIDLPFLSDDSAIGLIMPKTLIADTLSQLNKYALFFKTELSNISDQVNICGSVKPLANEEQESKQAYSVEQKEGDQREISLTLPTLNPRLNEERKISLSFDRGNTSGDSGTSDIQRWRAKNLLHGTLLIEPEMKEQFIPLELNYHAEALQGVNFDKGCYTGQEIVARLHYRGESKYRLTSMTVSLNKENESLQNATPAAVMENLDQEKAKKVGRIVSHSKSESDIVIATLIKHTYLEETLETENSAEEKRKATLGLLFEGEQESVLLPTENVLVF